MGGPAASVLLKNSLDADQIRSLRKWLAERSDFYGDSPNGDLRDGWEFFLRWPAVLGDEPDRGPCLGSLQLFTIDPEAECSGEQCLTPGEWARYSTALRWMPACELSVSIFCKQPRDHKTLAWLCAELADRFDGMIDAGGRLSLPDRSEWQQAELVGTFINVQPEILPGFPWNYFHLVDAAFLRGWMRQPDFHMIK